MTKIDMSGWKTFVVGELFPSIVKPPVLHARQVVEADDGIHYVVRTKFNNGIKCRIRPVTDVAPSPAGVITWGAENAAFFYQAEEFLSGRDIYYVDTRAYSATTCMFLATCLQTVTHKYPYNYGLFPDMLKEEQISLPVDASGKPDWAYMDKYMSAVMRESWTCLENIKKVKKEFHQVNVSGWRQFSIGSLFRIEKGTRLTRAEMIDGDTPFIGATLENNGITARVGNIEHVHPGGLMTVAYNGQKATGKAFYQPISFWASDDVNVLYPKFSLTEYIALFLAPLFWEAGRPYSFGDKWSKDAMEDDCLSLPANASGKPDWDYMDKYMRTMMDNTKSDLSAMRSIG
jgi:hypothetical protein